MSKLNYNWREKAAATTASNDNDVEKAFMDQAYGWVANKAGPLMNDPNRLGFEIVDKNDTNTRMVGIFAFRINKELLYVPVFFLNGEIKGTDLLYQCNTKTFKPLTKEWVTTLMEKGDQNDGEGISKDERRFMPQDVNFRSIAQPPGRSGGTKNASEEMLKAAGYDSWADWAKDASTLTEVEPILRRFMLEDGGPEALSMIEKAATDSYDFANMLVYKCDEDTYAPVELGSFHKKASAKSGLTLVVGQIPDGCKEASLDAGFFKRGFMLLDDRNELKDELTTVMQDDTQQLEQFCGPGLYEVMMIDGSSEKGFVACESDNCFNSEGNVGCPAPCCASDWKEGQSVTTTVVVLKDGKNKVCTDVLGKQVKDIQECMKDNELLDTMKTGTCYRVFDNKKGTLSAPIYVTEKKKNKGITIYTAYTDYNSPFQLRHNPDFNGCDFSANILGAGTKFIKVDCKTEKVESSDYYRVQPNNKFSTGTHDTIRAWIYEAGAKKASVRKGVDGYYTVRLGEKTAAYEMTAPGMAAFLARDLMIPGNLACDIVEDATNNKRADFWLMAKSATALRMMREPNFVKSYDTVFGTEVENPQNFEIPISGDNLKPPDSRIGDAWDPKNADGLPGNVLSSADPSSMQQLADMYKLPHVFEHGVVGSLTKTFDSVAMIDKYLPDMEKALDSMGRIIFLFYWKPDEFEDAYGSDDMSNLENELLSNFKQFGDLVLNLTKKSKIRRSGDESPLTSS